MTAPRWDRDTPARTDLQRALVTRAAANPLVAAWRWRYEIVLMAGSAAGLTAAIISLGVAPTIVAVIVITLAILCWPTARQLAACWAQDVAIFFDLRRPQLVTLDVIRRPPSDPSGDLEGHRTFDPPAGSTAWPSDQDM